MSTHTSRVIDRINLMSADAQFSIADFRDFPTNISHVLTKLCFRGEIILIERKKIAGTRTSLNLYRKTSSLGKLGEVVPTCMGWENVYPEFFTLPKFNIIQVIQVGERL